MLSDLWEMYVERKKIEIVLGIVVLFLVSMTMSCQELHYMVAGKIADAKIEQSRLDRVGGTDDAPLYKRVVTLAYMDKDTFRREYKDVPLDWNPENATSVKVQYFPGSESSVRIYGEHHYGWVSIFILSIVLLIAGAIMVGRGK